MQGQTRGSMLAMALFWGTHNAACKRSQTLGVINSPTLLPPPPSPPSHFCIVKLLESLTNSQLQAASSKPGRQRWDAAGKPAGVPSQLLCGYVTPHSPTVVQDDMVIAGSVHAVGQHGSGSTLQEKQATV